MNTNMARRGSLYQVSLVLCVIGGILMIVMHVIAAVNLGASSEVLIRNIAGIFIGVLVIMATGFTKSRKRSIPFEWWIMLIFGIIDAILAGNVGTVLVLIGAILLLIDAI